VDTFPSEEFNPEEIALARDLIRQLESIPKIRELLRAYIEGARTKKQIAGRLNKDPKTVSKLTKTLKKILQQ